MRQLKFRMWNAETKCIYEDTGLTSHGLNNAIELAEKNNYILMQYTGLKDKNGVEIYEGDVLSGLYGEQKDPDEKLKSVKGGVRFGSGSFEVDFRFFTKSLYDMDGNKAFCWRMENYLQGIEWFYTVKYLEVLGNIYENPELLKEEEWKR